MKVQINLSDELVEKVGLYARKIGVSRSSLCAFFIGQNVMNYDNTFINSIFFEDIQDD